MQMRLILMLMWAELYSHSEFSIRDNDYRYRKVVKFLGRAEGKNRTNNMLHPRLMMANGEHPYAVNM